MSETLSRVSNVTIFSSCFAQELAFMLSSTSTNKSDTFSVMSSSKLTSIFSPVSLLPRTATLLFRSLGPNSNLRGVPLSSQSKNFLPGLMSLVSICTLIPLASNASLISLHLAITSSPPSLKMIGIIVICFGEISGGN